MTRRARRARAVRPGHRRGSSWAVGAALVVSALGAAGCGVTHDKAARVVDAPPFGLLDTTTTSTTEPPPPPATAAPAPPTTEAATTTTVPTEVLTLYYSVGDRVRRTFRAVPLPAGSARLEPALVLGQLQAGPGDATLANVATPDMVAGLAVDRGRATVTITATFSALPPPLQLAVAAQLVLTLTDRPGIGRVLFVNAAAEPTVVPRADGSAAEDVSAEDYTPLLVP